MNIQPKAITKYVFDLSLTEDELRQALADPEPLLADLRKALTSAGLAGPATAELRKALGKGLAKPERQPKRPARRLKTTQAKPAQNGASAARLVCKACGARFLGKRALGQHKRHCPQGAPANGVPADDDDLDLSALVR